MRKLMLVSSIMFLIAGQTMGQSTVSYELEVGGSNNGATCASPVYFTPGQTTDGPVQLDGDGRLTWAVRIRANGTHQNASGSWVNIRGVANFVFDLLLYNYDAGQPGGMGTLVNTATFMSTANANTASCGIEQDWSNAAIATTYLSNAAFAYSFNMNLSGPARVIDWWQADASGHKPGGLKMDVRCYPKATGAGKLLGMGAGYSSWNKTFSTYSTGGLGRGEFESRQGYSNTVANKASGDSVWGHLGFGPVCEGQIEGLVAGNAYVLRLIPGSELTPGGGINVVRNEATSYAEVFATAATNASAEDTITFTVQSPVIPIHVTGWSSVRNCGGANVPIPLDPAAVPGGAPSTETRSGGAQTIVVDFDADVTSAYAPGHITLNNGLTLVNESLINSGHSLQISVANCQDTYCYKIDITGAVSLAPGEDADCYVQALAGDVNGDGTTNLIDMAFVKSKNGAALAGNERFDANCDGMINLIDMAFTKARNGAAANCVP